MNDLSHSTLVFLDYFFVVFHTVYTFFSVFGWIWRKTRLVHLVTCVITLFSWLILGLWYGLGYCLLTDWHWDVLRALGKPPNSSSYVHFMIRETTGFDLSAAFVNTGIFLIFTVCFILSIWLNLRDYRRRMQTKRGTAARTE
jgi:hypothetical protein